jgi:hypothetical protein
MGRCACPRLRRRAGPKTGTFTFAVSGASVFELREASLRGPGSLHQGKSFPESLTRKRVSRVDHRGASTAPRIPPADDGHAALARSDRRPAHAAHYVRLNGHVKIFAPRDRQRGTQHDDIRRPGPGRRQNVRIPVARRSIAARPPPRTREPRQRRLCRGSAAGSAPL